MTAPLPDNPATQRIASLLCPFLPEEELSIDENHRVLFSADVFHQGAIPAAVFQPGSTETLLQALKVCAKNGIATVTRGGGISYSGSYICARDDILLIDMRRLNKVISIDHQRMTVTAEAGCTWAMLDDALSPLGLRARFWGPASGRDATIGGTLSQQAVLLGSGRYGTAGDNIIAMTIATANGELVEAGNHVQHEFLPTDFIGDCGALGIKVNATLPLIRRPHAKRFSAFRFVDDCAAISAMKKAASLIPLSEIFLFDRCWSDRRKGIAATETRIESLPGHSHGTASTFELHAAFEGDYIAPVDQAYTHFQEICSHLGGVTDGDGVLSFFHNHPFGPPALLFGPNGRRWVPMHLIVPIEDYAAMRHAIHSAIRAHEALIHTHDIEWGYSVMLIGGRHILIEPSLYWVDRQPEQVRAYFDPSFLAAQPDYAPAPERLAAVHQLRTALIAAGQTVNARHMQIGRLYPARAAFTSWELPAFDRLKALLDPDERLNPGVFNQR